jgi:hypothetical protein
MRTFTFSVKDKTYTLRYNFNAIVDIEDTLKKPITQLVQGDQFGLKEIRAIIWGGLKHENNGLTLQQTGFLIDDYTQEQSLSELIENAVKLIAESINVK